MARIGVEVVGESEQSFQPGIAVVSLDGQVIAKLRTGESIEVSTMERISTCESAPPLPSGDDG